MTPIDRELEQALSAHATELTPPGDLFAGVERKARGIRRRRNAAVGAGALSILAIAVAIPLAVGGTESDPAPRPAPFATQPASPTAAPTAVLAPTRPPDGPMAASRLGWEPRGQSSESLLARAVDAWVVDHPDTVGYYPLFSAPLPDKRMVMAFEAVEAPGDLSYAVFYVEEPDGSAGRIVQGLEIVDRNPQGPAEGKQSQTRLPQISAYIDGEQNFVVIVGAPTTGQVMFSTDGRRYTDVDSYEDAGGVGVVAVTTGEERKDYRVRMYDGDGVEVYDGPIDLLSED